MMQNAAGGNIFHGTAVALHAAGRSPAAVLLRGRSGAGKSDLAFRLIEAGGVLVSDDQVALAKRHTHVYAESVESIRGLIEVRGVGLLRYPVAEQTRLRLVIDLVAREDAPRLPEWETVDILGVALPRLRLHAFEASAPLKVMKAMEIVHKPEMIVK
jgi:serine kinase of HPr protein (carbohydrate metabolism regulator)